MADNNKAVGSLAAAKLVTLIKAETGKKYDKTGGKIDGSAEITGGLKVGMSSEFSSSIKAESEISSDMLLMAPIVALYDPAKEEIISFGVSGENAAKVTSFASGGGVQYARLKVATPTGDNDAATKAYVDSKSAVATASANGLMSAADKVKLDGVEAGANKTIVDDAMSDTSKNPVQNKVIKKYVDDRAVRYDAAQTLDKAQQFQARKNIGAVGYDSPQFQGFLTLTPANAPLGIGVGLSPIRSGNGFALDISDVNEDTPTLLTGVKTPTDADTNAAATVEYVNNKVSEVSSSGGVTVDTAMSDTSTNPVQNKTIKQYVDDNAVSLPLTLTYANGQATGAAYTDIRKAIESGRQIKLAVANTIDIIASNARNETNKSVLMFTNTDVGGDTVNISQYTVTAQASGLTCNVKSHELE